MTTRQASGNEQMQRKESDQEPEALFQSDEDIAWEPLEGNLWIPHRIRGSWRGGVLG